MNNDLVDLKMYISEYNGYKPMMWTNEKAAIATNEIGWAIDEIVKRNINNSDIMLEAIKFSASYIKDIGDELINNNDFILDAYSANPEILTYFTNIEKLEKIKGTILEQKENENQSEISEEVSAKKM